MDFVKTVLKEEFRVYRIISLHYFEFAKDFVFEGEKHDFWEFLYVDKGEAEIMAGATGYKLKQGDVIFHKPNEFHSVWANKKIAPNLIVVSFECNSSSMGFFENKLFNLSDNERNVLATVVKEGFNAFLPPFDIPKVNTLAKKESAPFGCEQLIKINLELLLVNLVRKGTSMIGDNRLSSSAKERSEDEIIKRVTQFMYDNISKNLTLKQLCSFTNLGETHLKTIFKAKTGTSVIEYFKTLKMEQAKILIREEKYNFTEIAEKLGYSSIHNFSRYFKIVTDMAPSEYARTVKARIL
jgi:AraC-like DNA-binding protein